ncbi:MAG: hypothetical protein AAB133_09280 [Pseudomonadota bacterium]
MPEPLIIAKAGNTELALLPALANRHGLIAGAALMLAGVILVTIKLKH